MKYSVTHVTDRKVAPTDQPPLGLCHNLMNGTAASAAPRDPESARKS